MTASSVLVIDDDSAARQAVAEGLKREGFDLYFAENGREGLKLLQETAPTVVILDLRMPVMDGLEFLSNIDLRPSDCYSVIVLTGHGDTNAVKACYDAGVSSFIKKPFNFYEMRGVVKNAIAVKQLTTQLGEMVQERTAELEQRMREVTALNKFSQETLNRAAERDTGCSQIMEELQGLAPRAADLARRTQSLSNLQNRAGQPSGVEMRILNRATIEAVQGLTQDLVALAKRADALIVEPDDSGPQQER